jgi:uncharacterized protein YecT (DUF1311 family)
MTGATATDTIRARIDPKLKKDAAEVLEAMGLSITDAIRMLLIRVEQSGTTKDNLIRAERAWLAFHSASSNFESSLYGSETVSSFQVMQKEIFRLSERANVLQEYLSIADHR